MKLCLVIAGSRSDYAEICGVLTRKGYVEAVSDNGPNLFIVKDSTMPDIMLVSCDDPERDGPEMISNLDALKNAQRNLLLLCADQATCENVEDVMRWSQNKYFVKPVDAVDAANTIRKAASACSYEVTLN